MALEIFQCFRENFGSLAHYSEEQMLSGQDSLPVLLAEQRLLRDQGSLSPKPFHHRSLVLFYDIFFIYI